MTQSLSSTAKSTPHYVAKVAKEPAEVDIAIGQWAVKSTYRDTASDDCASFFKKDSSSRTSSPSEKNYSSKSNATLVQPVDIREKTTKEQRVIRLTNFYRSGDFESLKQECEHYFKLLDTSKEHVKDESEYACITLLYGICCYQIQTDSNSEALQTFKRINSDSARLRGVVLWSTLYISKVYLKLENDLNAHLSALSCLELLGDPPLTCDYLQSLQLNIPSKQAVYLQLALSTQNSSPAKAISYFKQSLSEAEKSSAPDADTIRFEASYGLANLFFTLEQYDKALKLYLHCKEKKYDSDAYADKVELTVGICCLKLNIPGTNDRFLTFVISLFENCRYDKDQSKEIFSLYILLAECLIVFKQWQKANSILTKVVEYIDNDIDVSYYRCLSHYHFQQKHYKDAVKYSATAIKITFKNEKPFLFCRLLCEQVQALICQIIQDSKDVTTQPYLVDSFCTNQPTALVSLPTIPVTSKSLLISLQTLFTELIGCIVPFDIQCKNARELQDEVIYTQIIEANRLVLYRLIDSISLLKSHNLMPLNCNDNTFLILEIIEHFRTQPIVTQLIKQHSLLDLPPPPFNSKYFQRTLTMLNQNVVYMQTTDNQLIIQVYNKNKQQFNLLTIPFFEHVTQQSSLQTIVSKAREAITVEQDVAELNDATCTMFNVNYSGLDNHICAILAECFATELIEYQRSGQKISLLLCQDPASKRLPLASIFILPSNPLARYTCESGCALLHLFEFSSALSLSVAIIQQRTNKTQLRLYPHDSVVFGHCGDRRNHLEISSKTAPSALLEYVEAELGSLKFSRQSKMYLNKRTSVRNFVECCKQYSALHIATHGKDGMMLFAGQNKTDELYYMHCEAILPVKISTPLFVYAATCESAEGVEHFENVDNLEKTFISRGTQALVTSYGTVLDEASLIFSTFFYYYIEQGVPIISALNQAQCTIMLEPCFRHPINWANYQITTATDLQVNSKNQLQHWIFYQKYFSDVVRGNSVYWLSRFVAPEIFDTKSANSTSPTSVIIFDSGTTAGLHHSAILMQNIAIKGRLTTYLNYFDTLSLNIKRFRLNECFLIHEYQRWKICLHMKRPISSENASVMHEFICRDEQQREVIFKYSNSQSITKDSIALKDPEKLLLVSQNHYILDISQPLTNKDSAINLLCAQFGLDQNTLSKIAFIKKKIGMPIVVICNINNDNLSSPALLELLKIKHVKFILIPIQECQPSLKTLEKKIETESGMASLNLPLERFSIITNVLPQLINASQNRLLNMPQTFAKVWQDFVAISDGMFLSYMPLEQVFLLNASLKRALLLCEPEYMNEAEAGSDLIARLASVQLEAIKPVLYNFKKVFFPIRELNHNIETMPITFKTNVQEFIAQWQLNPVQFRFFEVLSICDLFGVNYFPRSLLQHWSRLIVDTQTNTQDIQNLETVCFELRLLYILPETQRVTFEYQSTPSQPPWVLHPEGWCYCPNMIHKVFAEYLIRHLDDDSLKIATMMLTGCHSWYHALSAEEQQQGREYYEKWQKGVEQFDERMILNCVDKKKLEQILQ